MARLTSIAGLTATVTVMLAMAGAQPLVAQAGAGARSAPFALTEQERQFADRMKDASLVGRFTVDGRDDQAASPDRYDLAGVEKVGDDLWRFSWRMKRNNADVTLPITLPMRWVGDTPMIVLTDFSIPTMGAYSVRLLFYGDRYAGTWQSGKTGGLMYGRIEKKPEKKP